MCAVVMMNTKSGIFLLCFSSLISTFLGGNMLIKQQLTKKILLLQLFLLHTKVQRL